ncbi:fumarylacetoacetate hydrolase family protein [Rhodoferax antarcticus]|uniref:Fumarylacetoacetate (FAA) hydrolase family protein n=1 Tax=Rhodoferax antarcticus ANT.BR TaxID=1111071 RepID=A0A1Q8YE47_9BURK|nr:fumarylacetoacetate hydrolase family protein [Rhodoferax antarcticus]APW46126.1 5-carboxymethyl-2-hydroxymuconate isomerase [Rhodoferax antarcticus]OLP06303.1 fumarylacetoacetate (FAA) hydrolase family protein [Rhodoferax antarcticus ANT.BR]
MTNYVFTPAPVISVPVVGTGSQFPVHRIYCVGQNYAEHAQEMGSSGREPPFFFMKPADALVLCPPGQTTPLPYPSLTSNLHHEVELVVAIGTGGKNIPVDQALQHVFGYAVGLDMTRRDLQAALKKQGRPWCIAKGFDHGAPIGPITPAQAVPGIHAAKIDLSVNRSARQHGQTSQLICSVAETIAQLSAAWELQPGDLIFTGTPAGVGAVVRGDRLQAGIEGLTAINLQVV